MSRVVAPVASRAGPPPAMAFFSEATYHHSIGAVLAMNICHSSRAALPLSCLFALFVNPGGALVHRPVSSLCATCTLEHERFSQAACLQRRHEQLSAAGASLCSVAGALPFSAPHCRRAAAHTAGGQLSRSHHLSTNVHRTFNESIPCHTVALDTESVHGA